MHMRKHTTVKLGDLMIKGNINPPVFVADGIYLVDVGRPEDMSKDPTWAEDKTWVFYYTVDCTSCQITSRVLASNRKEAFKIRNQIKKGTLPC